MAINVGFVFSFGSMFTAILDRFKESRASTAAIQSVFVGVGPSSGKTCTTINFKLARRLVQTRGEKTRSNPLFQISKGLKRKIVIVF